MAIRVYFESIKKWALGIGITGVAAFGIIFAFLISSGALTVDGYSGDVVCAGTIEDPCLAFLNVTAQEDIFLYPIEYDPWGRDTPFAFDPSVKEWKLYRSWGDGWREINLDTNCKGTWCGAPSSTADTKYSFAFREGRSYQLKVEALKYNSYDSIKWGFFLEDAAVDPEWLGVTTQDYYAQTMRWEGVNQTIYPMDMQINKKDNKAYKIDSKTDLKSSSGYEFRYKEGDMSKNKLHHIEIFKDDILYWIIDTNCTPWQNDDIRETAKFSYPEGGSCTDTITSDFDLIILNYKVCHANSYYEKNGSILQGTSGYSECLDYPSNMLVLPIYDTDAKGNVHIINWSSEETSFIEPDETDIKARYSTPYDPSISDFTDLVAYFPCDEGEGHDLFDNTGTNLKRTYTPAVGDPTWRTGSDCIDNGTCVKGNEVGSFWDQTYSDPNIFGSGSSTTNHTLIGWFKPEECANTWSAYFGQQHDLMNVFDGSNIKLHFRDDGGSWYGRTTSCSPDTWYLSMFSYNADTNTTAHYINCESIGANYTGMFPYDPDGQFAILGAWNDGYQNATVQHIAGYEKVLTVAECEQFMDDTNGTDTPAYCTGSECSILDYGGRFFWGNSTDDKFYSYLWADGTISDLENYDIVTSSAKNPYWIRGDNSEISNTSFVNVQFEGTSSLYLIDTVTGDLIASTGGSPNLGTASIPAVSAIVFNGTDTGVSYLDNTNYGSNTRLYYINMTNKTDMTDFSSSNYIDYTGGSDSVRHIETTELNDTHYVLNFYSGNAELHVMLIDKDTRSIVQEYNWTTNITSDEFATHAVTADGQLVFSFGLEKTNFFITYYVVNLTSATSSGPYFVEEDLSFVITRAYGCELPNSHNSVGIIAHDQYANVGAYIVYANGSTESASPDKDGSVGGINNMDCFADYGNNKTIFTYADTGNLLRTVTYSITDGWSHTKMSSGYPAYVANGTIENIRYYPFPSGYGAALSTLTSGEDQFFGAYYSPITQKIENKYDTFIGKGQAQSHSYEGYEFTYIIGDIPTPSLPPTTPTNLTREGTTNFTGTFSGTQNLNCGGSTDYNDDTITYIIEKGNETIIPAGTAHFYDVESGMDDYTGTATGSGSVDFVDYADGNYSSATHSFWANDDGGAATRNWLTSPNITIPNGATSPQLTFWLRIVTEADYDGAWLDYSIDGGEWTLAATGDLNYSYTGVAGPGNPSGEHVAWDGDVGDIGKVKYTIPDAAIGANISFRWIMESDTGYDTGGAGENINDGIWVDDINVSYSSGTSYTYTVVGNHTTGNYSWDLSGEVVETYEKFRCRAIDLDGTNTYTDYYTIDSNFTIGSTGGVDTNFTIRDYDWETWVDYATSGVYLSFACTPTQTDCEPDLQDADFSASVFQVCNNGTVAGTGVYMSMNNTIPNIALKCDDDYTATGATTLTTSNQTIHGALAIDACTYISCWADYSNPTSGGYFDVHAYVYS